MKPKLNAISLTLLMLTANVLNCGDDAAEESHSAHSKNNAVTTECSATNTFIITAEMGSSNLADANMVISIKKGESGVTDAQLSVTPTMPAHDHPNDGTTPMITEAGHGTYTAAMLGLTMAGEWDFAIKAMKDNEMDCTKFTFTIEP